MYDESIDVLNAEEVQSPTGSNSSADDAQSNERQIPMVRYHTTSYIVSRSSIPTIKIKIVTSKIVTRSYYLK